MRSVTESRPPRSRRRARPALISSSPCLQTTKRSTRSGRQIGELVPTNRSAARSEGDLADRPSVPCQQSHRSTPHAGGSMSSEPQPNDKQAMPPAPPHPTAPPTQGAGGAAQQRPAALQVQGVRPLLQIHLLGECRLVYDGAPVRVGTTARLHTLLAYLLLHRDAPQSRHHLAYLFWPDAPEEQARNNLRQLLHQLRHALPDADRFLSADATTLCWRADAAFSLDVAEFERL